MHETNCSLNMDKDEIENIMDSYLINCNIRLNDMDFWNLDQKIINIFLERANEELSDLDLIPYDYGYYTETWSKIDFTLKGPSPEKYVVAKKYLCELIECYERIKHLLSVVLLNESFSNRYTGIKHQTLPENNVEFRFDIQDNFKIYDRYYLLYSELTIESLYIFWERIAFYLFQFFKPESGKINEKNLSFQKLIKELQKDVVTKSFLKNEHFTWFVDFVSDPSSDFQNLTSIRHPSVHFKYNNISGKGNGSLIADVISSLEENLFDEAKLKNLEIENKKIKESLLKQFKNCKIGYSHMIELVKSLPDKNLL